MKGEALKLRISRRWRAQRLHVQLAFLGSLVIAVTLAFDTYLNTTIQSRNAFEKLQSAAIALTKNIAITSAYQIIDDDLASLEDLLLKSSQFPDVKAIQVYDNTGRALGSVFTAPGNNVFVDYSNALRFVASHNDTRDYPLVARHTDSIVVTHRIDSHQPLGWVVLTYDLSPLNIASLTLWRDNIIMAFVAILIDITLLVLIIRPQTLALRKAARFASGLDRHSGGVIHAPGTSREVGQLIEALNNASAQLKYQHDEIKQGKVQTKAIIAELETTKSSLEQRVEERTRELAWQATHDPLTGLSNRFEFEERLAKLIESARHGGRIHALCYLDLDKFKVVNDSCGHLAGDALLKQLGAVLTNALDANHLVARLGGDEFGVLLEDCTLAYAETVATRILNCVRQFRFTWQDKAYNIGVSIGLAQITDETKNIADVLTTADVACYVAKERGRNGIHIYQANNEDLAQRRMDVSWIENLHNAIEENRFCLFRQPILPTSESSVNPSHYEILLRLRDKNENLIKPDEFLPAAEQFNLLAAIDRWVIDQVFNIYAAQEKNANNPSMSDLCSINLSGATLSDPLALAYISNKFAQYNVAAHNFCFEITETAVISNLGDATTFINELRQLGCRFSLDDFGTGLASFSYFKALPVDFIKIDGSFVRNMLKDHVDRAIVESINSLAHKVGLRTIAEYVETEAVRTALLEIGVDYVQGRAVGQLEPLISSAPEFNLTRNPTLATPLVPYIGNIHR